MSKKKTTYDANQQRIDKQKQLLLEQLKKTPVIEIACQKLGIGRTTFYRWQREDELFNEECYVALEQGTNLINDLAESKLIGQIQDGEFAAIRFWLQNHKNVYGNKLQISAGKSGELTDAEQAILTQSFELAGHIDTPQADEGSATVQSDSAQPDSSNDVGAKVDS